jgi:hypothetical protein
MQAPGFDTHALPSPFADFGPVFRAFIDAAVGGGSVCKQEPGVESGSDFEDGGWGQDLVTPALLTALPVVSPEAGDTLFRPPAKVDGRVLQVDWAEGEDFFMVAQLTGPRAQALLRAAGVTNPTGFLVALFTHIAMGAGGRMRRWTAGTSAVVSDKLRLPPRTVSMLRVAFQCHVAAPGLREHLFTAGVELLELDAFPASAEFWFKWCLLGMLDHSSRTDTNALCVPRHAARVFVLLEASATVISTVGVLSVPCLAAMAGVIPAAVWGLLEARPDKFSSHMWSISIDMRYLEFQGVLISGIKAGLQAVMAAIPGSVWNKTTFKTVELVLGAVKPWMKHDLKQRDPCNFTASLVEFAMAVVARAATFTGDVWRPRVAAVEAKAGALLQRVLTSLDLTDAMFATRGIDADAVRRFVDRITGPPSAPQDADFLPKPPKPATRKRARVEPDDDFSDATLDTGC